MRNFLCSNVHRGDRGNAVKTFRTAALFAGIGGVELGLADSGHEANLFCEFDGGAGAVLRHNFPDVPFHNDVRTLRKLPDDTTLLTAGFPCQDLSQAGGTRGIQGERSGLVGEVFRLLRNHEIPNVLLENVPFMLQLDRGQAMRIIAAEFEKLGYRWAYRVVDSRAFGLPQRRQRVFFFASRESDPSQLLFQDDAGPEPDRSAEGRACGFYWTEGVRGLGWAIDAVPTLKGGSTIGIPSPPAIWFPDGRIAKPDLRDAERLQGFPDGWTEPAESIAKASLRWKLVGNAVSVNTAKWVGEAISRQPIPLSVLPLPFEETKSWPLAAFGSADEGRFEVLVSMWPRWTERPPLEDFLRYEPEPLSHRAVSGFLERLQRGNLRYPPEFLAALLAHRKRSRAALETA